MMTRITKDNTPQPSAQCSVTESHFHHQTSPGQKAASQYSCRSVSVKAICCFIVHAVSLLLCVRFFLAPQSVFAHVAGFERLAKLKSVEGITFNDFYYIFIVL